MNVFIDDSYSSQPKADHYWDQGEKAIFAFLDQHKEACQTNWVCNALNLANITTTTDPLGNESDEPDLSVSSSPPRKRAKYNKADVSFMLMDRISYLVTSYDTFSVYTTRLSGNHYEVPYLHCNEVESII